MILDPRLGAHVLCFELSDERTETRWERCRECLRPVRHEAALGCCGSRFHEAALGLLRLALPAPAGLLRPRVGAGLLPLALTATTTSLLDPSLPALPSGPSPPRRGPRRSRLSTFRNNNIRSPPPFAIARVMAAKLKPNGSLLSRTLNTLTLCRVPDTRKNLWARVRQGSRLEDRFIGPANLFLPLASSAAPKFQSQETRAVG
jgi:hypothetical protein